MTHPTRTWAPAAAMVATLLAAALPAAAQEPNYTSPPISGELLRLRDGVKLVTQHAKAQVVPHEGGRAIRVQFQTGEAYPNVQMPVPEGGWNLSAFAGVEVTVRHVAGPAATVNLRADNPGDWRQSPWNTANADVGPGKTATIRLRFGQDNQAPGYPLDSQRVAAMQVFLVRPKQPVTLLITDLRAWGTAADSAVAGALSRPQDRNVPVTPPPWLGQRPPVDGEWVQTLDENFDAERIDERLWSDRTWWNGLLEGQTQRYSPQNLVLENGVLRMKIERRPGHQYDDPTLPRRDYATGHIITYGKWTQLYGYFEGRLKLPTAPGLWPAFWMMPDRGAEHAAEGWKRESTERGGMEVDIMEFISQWGPGRSNVAAHWDGYGDEHKSWGNAHVYFGPTYDGWHTFGLLWEPGGLTWYIDGAKKAELKSPRVGSVPAYLILNVQTGGWAGDTIDESRLPDYFEVDYVRAWQLRERMPR